MINGAIMSIKQLSLVVAVSALTFTTATNAVLGPIPIYLNTEYKTSSPVIRSIAPTITITSDDIENSGVTTLTELLVGIPSVNLVKPQGNTTSVFIRGLKSKYTKVLIDGIEVPSSFDAPILDIISINQIERIEVVKGGFSSLYGSGAIAGVIQIFTKKSIIDNNNGSVGLVIGSNNIANKNFSYGIKKDNLTINISASNSKTDGINATTADIIGETDGEEKSSNSLSATYYADNGSQTTLSHLDTSYIYDYDSCDKVTYDENWNKTTLEISNNCSGELQFSQENLSHSRQIKDSIKTTISIATTKNIYTHTSRYTGYVAESSYTNFDNTTINWTNDITLSNGLLTAGISKDSKKAFGTYTYGVTRSISETGIFGQYQTTVANTDVVLGLRNNNNSKFDNVTTYNLGLGKLFKNNTKITFNHGTSYKAPSLSSLYGNYGNNQLKAEDSTNTEFGILKEYEWGNLSTNIYKINIADGIKYSNNTYVNVDEVNSQGLEILANTTISDWNIKAEYNHNKSREGSSTQQADRRPKHTINFSANKQFGKLNTAIDLSRVSTTNDYNWSTYQSEELAGYTLLNLSGNYQLDKDITISGKINNLTDKNYTRAVGYNQAGRTISLGITHSF